jgi:hypothetical protein
MALGLVNLEGSEENLSELKSARVLTFGDYVSRPEREYYGVGCDTSIIPKRFLHQCNRLVKIYNSLLDEENINLEKLERVISIAQRVVYKDLS